MLEDQASLVIVKPASVIRKKCGGKYADLGGPDIYFFGDLMGNTNPVFIDILLKSEIIF